MRYVTEIKENTIIGTYSLVATPDFSSCSMGCCFHSAMNVSGRNKSCLPTRDGTTYEEKT